MLMSTDKINIILEKQRRYFAEGATIPVKFRKEMLKKLYRAVKSNEEKICNYNRAWQK